MSSPAASPEVGRAQEELLAGETLAEREGLGRVARYADDGAERFLFQAPVVYRDQHIGELALGISSEPLTNALRVSVLAMASLMVATVLTVLAGTWVLSWRLRFPLRLLGAVWTRWPLATSATGSGSTGGTSSASCSRATT